jgi:hypothetical protein
MIPDKSAKQEKEFWPALLMTDPQKPESDSV